VKLHYPRIFVNKGKGIFRNFPHWKVIMS
jgi:hypothetical protein